MKVENLGRRVVMGFLTLTFRRALLYLIRFLTINIVLAQVLSPAVIGVFNIGNSILAFFSYFADVGLAAALIQKKEITDDDLKTTFTIQEILALVISGAVVILAPNFAGYYGLDQTGVWLIQALGIGFFLNSLKVLPAVLLERDLKFGPLVTVEILETMVFCGGLIWLSLSGWQINAFSVSVLLQSLVGVTLIYIIAPWRVRLGFSKEAAKKLFNFGLPFQLNSLLALLKDRLVPLVIAKMVGTAGVGYITWAQSLAFMPLEIMNIMTRVTFPAFARMQEDKEALKRTLEKSIFFVAVMMYPLLFGLLAIAPSLVAHVVSSKWTPALPMIYLFAVTTFWASLSTSFTNFLNAIGRIGITLKLMIMWTVLEWAITPILTIYYGFYGVGMASALIALTSIIPIFIVKRMIKVEILPNIWQALLSALVMAGVVYWLAGMLVVNFVTLLGVVAIGGVIYSSLILTFNRTRVISAFKTWRNA